ncbi:MAG: plastocyanin/azurin family copper-binding protein [Thermoleophilia bacterium]
MKLTGTIAAGALIAALILASCGEEKTVTTPTTPPPATGTSTSPPSASPQSFEFETPKKSAHYESNTPAHEGILAAAPINVVIDFNFDLAPPSAISVTQGGREYGTGETIIDDSKLAMRRNLDPAAPDGLYTVTYNACWPDGSCHDGYFQFAVDSSLTAEFTDMTGQPIVNVEMASIAFQPQKVIVDAGTTVTWTNRDAGVDHFVNTDSHPAHTYYPAQNSRGLSQGESFSVTFDRPGIYLYHCSAHAATMTGKIVVR